MQKIFCFVLVGMVLSGCGASGVRETRVASQPVYAPVALRSFPEPADQTLQNNKIFLWRQDMVDADVSTALRMAQRIDAIDTDYYMVDKRREAVATSENVRRVVITRGRLTSSRQQVLLRRTAVTRVTRARADAQRELDRARQSNNPEAIARWEAQVASKQSELEAATAQKEAADAALAQTEGEVKQLEEQYKPELDQLTAKVVQLSELQDSGKQATESLIEVVELDEDGPTSVRFDTLPDGSLSVYILGWAVGRNKESRERGVTRAARTFSTEDGSITNARYDREGGRVQFEVAVYSDEARTDLLARYSFKLARNEYAKTDDPEDGRIFYVGDVWREWAKPGDFCSADEYARTQCRRKGSAKFVSGNSRS